MTKFTTESSTRQWRASASLGQRLVQTSALTLALGIPGIALAQAHDPSAGSASSADPKAPQVEEIVVTASKRAEALSRSPITVSAVSQAALDRQGITDVSELSGSVPTLQIGIQSTGGAQLSIRGISTDDPSETSNPAVAFHIDGVYEPRPEGINQALYDVDRIEVLRGPQGTLYGRNATAGSVNVITAAPKNYFDISTDISYGNYNEILARGMINIPVTDTLAIRATIIREKNDGYDKNQWGGTGPTPHDLNYDEADNYGGRLTLLWHPTANLSWQVEGDYHKNEGTPSLNVPYPFPAGQTVRDLTVYKAGLADDKQSSIRSRLEWQFAKDWSLTDVAGYGSFKGTYQADGDGPYNSFIYNRDQNHYSNELDLAYNADHLKFIAGLYYFHENPNTDLDATFGPFAEQTYDDTLTQKSLAAFSQITYSLTQGLRLTGGIRYSHDEATRPFAPEYFCSATAAFSESQAASGCEAIGAVQNQYAKFSNVSWKIGADYDLTANTMLYGTVSTGYKAGGLGALGTPDFLPEHVINYEVGAKSRLFNNQLELNLSVFDMEYKDLQVETVLPSAANPVVENSATVNAATASSRGVELEAILAPTRDDHVSAYATYLDAHYDSFKNAVDSDTQDNSGCPTVSGYIVCNVSGKQLVLAPRYSFHVDYQHTIHIGNGTLVPSATFYWQDAMYLRPFGLAIDRQNAYTKTDLALTYTTPDRHWSLAGYVHNLENRNIATYETYFSSLLRNYQLPRTYGVRLAYKFH